MRLTNTENGQQSIISKCIAVTASLSLNAALLGRARVHSLCADVHPTVRGTGLIALAKAANQNRAA